MYPLLVPFNGKLASRFYGVYNQIIATFALETIHTDTLKKIRGSAVQENAIFVFISYNQQAKKRGNVKTCCRVEERQALLHPQRPRSLLRRLKSAEYKPVSLTEIVRQTMYLWENGQKEIKKTQK